MHHGVVRVLLSHDKFTSSLIDPLNGIEDEGLRKLVDMGSLVKFALKLNLGASAELRHLCAA